MCACVKLYFIIFLLLHYSDRQTDYTRDCVYIKHIQTKCLLKQTFFSSLCLCIIQLKYIIKYVVRFTLYFAGFLRRITVSLLLKNINCFFLATFRQLRDNQVRILWQKSLSFGKGRDRKQSISQDVFQMRSLSVSFAVKYAFHINTVHYNWVYLKSERAYEALRRFASLKEWTDT